jgi:hypothetical protein
MPNIRPDRLVLRCYGHRKKNGRYYGVCLELNIAAEAYSPDELKDKLESMIKSYIESVIDTEDKDSIPNLMSRKAPIKDWVFYYVISFIVSIRNFPTNFTFKRLIPFRLCVDNSCS